MKTEKMDVIHVVTEPPRLYAYVYNVLILILASCFLQPVASVSAGEQITITADHLEYFSGNNTYTAEGSVKITFEDGVLLTDEVHLDGNTYVAIATGNVVYEDSTVVIRSEKVELNLKTKLGTMHENYIFYKKHNYHIHSNSVKKTGWGSFFLNKATITTCDVDHPEWHLSGKNITITQHKSLKIWHNSLYIKNIPVFYAPYFWAPLIKERETGFLYPSYGYSSSKGHYFKQGFFWAIKDNHDATLYLDYYGEKGLAQGLDYRYILTPEINGELWMYNIRDDEPSRNLVEFKSYHNYKLPYDISGYLKLHAVNEYDYYDVMESTSSNRFGLASWKSNLFGLASEERLQKYLESNLHLSKQFDGGRTYFLSQGRQSLEGSSKAIPQSLPEIGFILNTRSKKHFSFNMAVKGANFWREDGQEGQRFDINPNVHLSLGKTINIMQRFGLRDTAYHLNSPELNKNRIIYDLGTSLKTRFLKNYDTFIHIVEPSLEYSYIPPVDNDNIPFFDSIDRITRTNNISYSLTNRISGLAANNLETRFRLTHSYSLLDYEKQFGPLLAEATLWSNKFTLETNASYDVHVSKFTETISTVHIKGKKAYAGVGKSFRRSSLLDQIAFEAGFNSPIIIFRKPLPFNLHGKIWYDLNSKEIQALNLRSTYTHQCWGFTVTFDRKSDEYQIMFNLEFKGLGSMSLGSVYQSI